MMEAEIGQRWPQAKKGQGWPENHRKFRGGQEGLRHGFQWDGGPADISILDFRTVKASTPIVCGTL